ncbi:MAG: DegT/DnrJ/EryC1/StrS family aminotransferase [bacterium]
MAAGAEPYFMDVDFETRCTTLAEVKRAIENEVKAVIVTHLYGLAIPEISQIAVCCAQKGVLLLEDCAQAHGAELENQKVGTFGDAACFSFYPTKNLGALGDGGAVVTNNSKLAEQIKLLRQYGWTRKYEVKLAGARNSRLDELQAAILSSFLPHLEAANARRREIAATYSEQIKHRGIRVPEKGGLNYVAHLYVVCSLKRNTLGEHLLASEIASDVHYPIPDYRQPVFDECFADLNLENTERLAKEVLTLPCYPEMTDSQVAQVVHTVNGWQS